jgi:hypothetical protein
VQVCKVAPIPGETKVSAHVRALSRNTRARRASGVAVRESDEAHLPHRQSWRRLSGLFCVLCVMCLLTHDCVEGW